MTTKKLLELRDQRGLALEEITALRDGIKAEGRSVTAAEQQDIEARFAKVTQLGKDIAEAEVEAEEQRKKLDAEFGGGGTRDNDGFGRLQRDEAASKGPLQTRSYQELARRTNTPVDLGPWKTEREFFEALCSTRFDERLNFEYRSTSTLVDKDGGFAVPTRTVERIMTVALENSVFLSKAKIYPMDTRKQEFPMFDGYDHTNEQFFGGFSLEWLGEEAEMSLTYPQLSMLALEAKKLVLGTRFSNEWRADAPAAFQDWTNAIGQVVAFGVDSVCINGTGSNKPQGVLNSPALITVSKETNQAANTILAENIVAMQARLSPGSFNQSLWLANPTTLPQLTQLAWPVGTGGALAGMLKDNGNGSYSLGSRPLVWTEKVPALGTKGDLLLLDPSRYAIGMRSTLRIDLSEHANFMNDRTVLRAITRLDGKGIDPTPTTPVNGDTTSPFVALETRS